MIITVAGMPQSGSTLLFNIIRAILDEYGRKYETCLYGPVSYNRVLNYRDLKRLSKSYSFVVKEHHFQKELAEISDFVFISKRDIRDSIASRRRKGKELISKGKRQRGLHQYEPESLSGFIKWCEYLTIDCLEDWSEYQDYLFDYDNYSIEKNQLQIIANIKDVLFPSSFNNVTHIGVNNVSSTNWPPAIKIREHVKIENMKKIVDEKSFFSDKKITSGGKTNNYKKQLREIEIDIIKSEFSKYIKEEYQ